MIARQAELQSATAEAAAIVRATPPESLDQRTVIRDVLATSTGLSSNEVVVAEVYRCGTNADYVTHDSCGNSNRTTYIKVRITDSYVPIWTEFGIGSTVNYDVVRTVQIG